MLRNLQDEAKDILSFRVTFASGHRVTALSMTILRGKRGKVVIDEFAFHRQGLMKAALALYGAVK